MTRVKSVAARKHRKIRKATKGFKDARRIRIKTGKEAVLHAGQYAYVGRRLKKRDLRSLWIMRLNAAARKNGLTYNKLIAGLKKEKIEIDRKILSEIAVKDPKTFTEIVNNIK
jgi:large subunit ribosomal protein L20